MIPPNISDDYRVAMDDMRKEVNQTSDDRALGMDTDEWVGYLIRKHAMEPLVVDLGAMTLEETSRSGYPAIRVAVPVAASETFDVIAQAGLAGPGAWLGFDYESFFSRDHPYTIGQVEAPEANRINTAGRRITEYVQALNRAIESENTTFPEKVRQVVTSRQEACRAKHRSLDALSAAVGIPLVRRAG